MVNKLLTSLMVILGIVALIVFTRDNPVYADGEPTIIVQNWLNKLPQNSENTSISATLLEDNWDEEYLGSGKWVVLRTQIYDDSSDDFDKWFERWRQVDVDKLREYTNDLPPEDLSTFQQGLWTTDHSDDLYETREESWYLFEKSGLVINHSNAE